MLVTIRVIAKLASLAEAEELEKFLLGRLSRWPTLPISPAESYWKIEGHFEVNLEIPKDDATMNDCKEIASALGTGWHEHIAFFTWNPEDGGEFEDASVTWAAVNLLD